LGKTYRYEIIFTTMDQNFNDIEVFVILSSLNNTPIGLVKKRIKLLFSLMGLEIPSDEKINNTINTKSQYYTVLNDKVSLTETGKKVFKSVIKLLKSNSMYDVVAILEAFDQIDNKHLEKLQTFAYYVGSTATIKMKNRNLVERDGKTIRIIIGGKN